MKRLIHLAGIAAVILMLGSCGNKDSKENNLPTEKSKILVNYPWRMSSVTDLNGKAISANQLNTQTQAIGEYMDIQFLTNNVTKAIERKSSQVINGGTWLLSNESSVLDITITGFTGQFGVAELTNSKMRLKSKMPVNGVEQETIMVFDPVIK